MGVLSCEIVVEPSSVFRGLAADCPRLYVRVSQTIHLVIQLELLPEASFIKRSKNCRLVMTRDRVLIEMPLVFPLNEMAGDLLLRRIHTYRGIRIYSALY